MGSRPFERVLVANRGEIACRIIATLDRLGIESVAVHSEADRGSLHVAMASIAVPLGGVAPTDSYLRGDAIVSAAIDTAADAIHPGYGFLSESAEFAAACEAAGIVFLGPTPEQIRQFGSKHVARELAARAGVPLAPGSGLLADIDAARRAAEAIGFPLMFKASAGGGGIGLRRCNGPDEVESAFDSVRRLAAANFGDGAVFAERFVERARHIEVQIAGDGLGTVVDLGERDCSVQRRHQKVIEEAPAPGISERLRERLRSNARGLAESVDYRSVGTVEFIVDADTLDRDDGGDAWFLEVNTRLQVEHGVTELVRGVDLVEWMVCLGAGERPEGFDSVAGPSGWAIEARLYAEDPLDDASPSSGLVTELVPPAGVRFDTWVDAGTSITPFYDPLIGKLLVHGPTRPQAIAGLAEALAATRVGGITTNRDQLSAVAASEWFRDATMTTTSLDGFAPSNTEIKVIDGGLFTTVQDLPARLGYWDVGIPPSGPMDDRSHRLANALLGNPDGAPALEVTLLGPTIEFRDATSIVLGGADFGARLDGVPAPMWTVIDVARGSRLELGGCLGPGMRGVVAVAGGFDVPQHLGSASTFVLGGFGGHGGRALRTGDVIPIGDDLGIGTRIAGSSVPVDRRPTLTNEWEIGVLAGPHAAPDYFTTSDIEMLYGTAWEVHLNSDRTGVRLIGPAPQWARPDGGEAGLHPSNIHDNAYAVGTIDFTGDMPIVLGRDGPSLGGFVCPATIAEREFWKIGQARAGDTVRFVPLDHDAARSPAPLRRALARPDDPVLFRRAATTDHPDMTIRRDGDRKLLVEYGDNVLDLLLRLRAGALMDALRADAAEPVDELVPGIRSLQIGFDPDRTSPREMIDLVAHLDDALGDISDREIPSRIVRLPLSWDDPATRLATERYMQSVRADAPWCPWNLEFIRRINGLDGVDDVKRIVFDASYLVLGLGDVYLGAPVATPIDPRHRLVTTKYNPARTWTAENSVGIGGSYLCIYGMEGPGGYQFIGRTVPIWDRWGRRSARGRRPEVAPDGDAPPWLLRFFDQIRWYEVGAEELLDLRAAVEAGQFAFDIEPTTFSVAEYLQDLSRNGDSIREFTTTRNAAFEAERRRWAAAGIEMTASNDLAPVVHDVRPVPDGMVAVAATVSGMVRTTVEPGGIVAAGDVVAVIEAMKMETGQVSPSAGTIAEIRVVPGDVVAAGGILAVIDPKG
ncbi:MAG: urea carboxylase [Ilumatobacteraceae bacterium]